MAQQVKQRSIIALKGAPFTRKSEYATLIATSLSCPLLTVEDFLDILGPDNLKINPAKGYGLNSSQSPQDLAMLIIIQMAATHLLKGVANQVVIDSPLSSQFQIDALFSVASVMENTRIVIVECKPKNLYLWRMLFERSTDQPRPWYKPKIWDEIELAIRNDCKLDDMRFDYHVSKLVLDPLEDYLYKPKSEWDKLSFEVPAFMEAIQYLMTRKEGDGGDAPGVVVFSKWRQSMARLSLTHKDSSKLKTGNQWCHKEGHHITKCAAIKGEEISICTKCKNEVTNGDLAYTCNICTLLLHKDCAESFKDDARFRNPYPQIYRPWESVTCASCKESGRGGSSWDNCSSCLFESNLKGKLMPVILRHDCDEHFLSLVLLASQGENESYSCSACAELVRFLFYACRICTKYYHLNCVNEIPSRVEHEHGGYDHHMRLMFSMPEEAEDYLCMECLEVRDPLKWFYSCEECPYEVHLGCILKKQEIGFCWKWILPN